jgi:hypothetical protein
MTTLSGYARGPLGRAPCAAGTSLPAAPWSVPSSPAGIFVERVLGGRRTARQPERPHRFGATESATVAVSPLWGPEPVRVVAQICGAIGRGDAGQTLEEACEDQSRIPASRVS